MQNNLRKPIEPSLFEGQEFDNRSTTACSSVSAPVSYEAVETPEDRAFGDAQRGVQFSQQLGAFISTYVDTETGLESRKYFYPHKYEKYGYGYEMARQAAIQHRQDYFLHKLHDRKENPEAVKTLKNLCVERKQAHTQASKTMQNTMSGFGGRIDDDVANSKPAPLDVEELEEKMRLRRIASAKKIPGLVKPVELPNPQSPSTAVSNPTAPSQATILVQVQPYTVISD